MKLLIELPTWMGDTVMVTPAIENLVNFFNNPEIVLIGSFISVEISTKCRKVVFITGDDLISDSPWIYPYYDKIMKIREEYKGMDGNVSVCTRPNISVNIKKFMVE